MFMMGPGLDERRDHQPLVYLTYWGEMCGACEDRNSLPSDISHHPQLYTHTLHPLDVRCLIGRKALPTLRSSCRKYRAVPSLASWLIKAR